MTIVIQRRALGAIAGLLLFTGCLTIEENYSFKKDGSGTMEYVVDMSQLGEMMSTLGEMGEGNEGGMEQMGTMDMSGEAEALKGIPGIGKVKLNSKEDWIRRLSFSFKNVDALNAALNVLMPDSTGATCTFFSWEGNTLVRKNNSHAYELGSGMAKDADADADGADDKDGLDLAEMMESMKYRYNFKFAGPIADTRSAEGVTKVSPSSKEVKLETDFGVIGRDPLALDLRIELDR